MDITEQNEQINQPDDELMEQLIPAYGLETDNPSTDDYDKRMEQLLPDYTTMGEEQSELVDDDTVSDTMEPPENNEPVSGLIDFDEEMPESVEREPDSVELTSELIEDTEPAYEPIETNEPPVETVSEPIESSSSDTDDYYS